MVFHILARCLPWCNILNLSKPGLAQKSTLASFISFILLNMYLNDGKKSGCDSVVGACHWMLMSPFLLLSDGSCVHPDLNCIIWTLFGQIYQDGTWLPLSHVCYTLKCFCFVVFFLFSPLGTSKRWRYNTCLNEKIWCYNFFFFYIGMKAQYT